MIERIRPTIARLWGGHQIVVIAVAAIAIVAIVGGSLLIATQSGGVAQATASPTPSASPSAAPSTVALASPSELPTTLPSPSDTPAASETPGPDWVYSDLDGVLAPPDLAHRLPMAIMIDDNAVARPQSGISSASIVYQAAADGGEDRYEMIFQEGTATDIGPVRSARPYFVYWADEYKALFGHFGGDAHSLKQVIPANAGYIYNEDDLNGGELPVPPHRYTPRSP